MVVGRLLAVLVLAGLLVGCGAGGGDQAEVVESYAAGETEVTERVDRQSTVAAEQSAAADEVEQSSAAEVAVEDVEEAEAEPEAGVLSGEVLSGHRAGLAAERNVFGDPEAAVTIVEYSDFQ